MPSHDPSNDLPAPSNAFQRGCLPPHPPYPPYPLEAGKWALEGPLAPTVAKGRRTGDVDVNRAGQWGPVPTSRNARGSPKSTAASGGPNRRGLDAFGATVSESESGRWGRFAP